MILDVCRQTRIEAFLQLQREREREREREKEREREREREWEKEREPKFQDKSNKSERDWKVISFCQLSYITLRSFYSLATFQLKVFLSVNSFLVDLQVVPYPYRFAVATEGNRLSEGWVERLRSSNIKKRKKEEKKTNIQLQQARISTYETLP